MVLISSVTSSLLFLIWRVMRGFFMNVDPKLIYKTLRWICIMYMLPFGYAAILVTYHGWFRGDIRLWSIIFVRSGEITYGVRAVAIVWFIVVIAMILFFVLGDLHWNLKRRDNILEEDPIVVEIFQRVCKSLDIPEGNVKLYRNVLVNTPLIIGWFHPEVLLPENNYTPQDLELIFFHELSHYKHGDLLFKKFVIIVILIHCINPIAFFLLFRTVNLWSECMADLSALEISGNLHRASRYYNRIVELIPHSKNAKQDSLFISTLSKDSKLLARRMNFMLKYLKTKPAGKVFAAVVAAAFVMMSATTAYASGKTVADMHNIIYQNTEDQLNEASDSSEPIPGTDVVTEDGMVEHYCNVEDLDMTNMQIVSFPDEDMVLWTAGVYYGIDWDVEANTRYVSGDYTVKSGGTIAASVTLIPTNKTCWLGIMNDHGTARYVEGAGALAHKFKIAETCKYRVFVQNNYKDGTLIHAKGSWVYEN